MENDKFDAQIGDNSAFDCLPVSSAVGRLRSDRYPGNYLKFDYPRNSFNKS